MCLDLIICQSNDPLTNWSKCLNRQSDKYWRKIEVTGIKTQFIQVCMPFSSKSMPESARNVHGKQNILIKQNTPKTSENSHTLMVYKL